MIRSMQFSLRSLLLVVIIVAIDCLLLVRPPQWIPLGCWLFVTYALPPALIVGLISGTRRQRAFCIGALFPSATTFLYLSVWLGASFLDESTNEWQVDWEEFGSRRLAARWYLGVSFAVSNIVGFLCAAISRALDQRSTNGE